MALPTFAQSSEPLFAFSFVSRRQLLSMAGVDPELAVAVTALERFASFDSDWLNIVDTEFGRWSRLLRPLEPPSSELAVVKVS